MSTTDFANPLTTSGEGPELAGFVPSNTRQPNRASAAVVSANDAPSHGSS